MKRAHRRAHVLIWLALAPIVAALAVWLVVGAGAGP